MECLGGGDLRLGRRNTMPLNRILRGRFRADQRENGEIAGLGISRSILPGPDGGLFRHTVPRGTVALWQQDLRTHACCEMGTINGCCGRNRIGGDQMWEQPGTRINGSRSMGSVIFEVIRLAPVASHLSPGLCAKGSAVGGDETSSPQR